MIWKGHRLQHRLYQNAETWGGRYLVTSSLGKTMLAGEMGFPTRIVDLVRKPFFALVALAFPLLCQGIALCPPMGVHPRKFPMGTLVFVGQGCVTDIHQIDHHNIDIGSDTVADAIFISGFVAGASHLHHRFLSKPSETQSKVSLSSNSIVRTDFQSLKPRCQDRATEVPLHWPWVMSRYG